MPLIADECESFNEKLECELLVTPDESSRLMSSPQRSTE